MMSLRNCSSMTLLMLMSAISLSENHPEFSTEGTLIPGYIFSNLVLSSRKSS